MKSRKDTKVHYCPGCGHTIVLSIMSEIMDELNIRENAIVSAPVGCAVLLYNYLNTDMIECAHGRVPAVLTAIKRCNPDNFVLAYQGDGDLAAIGTNETIHAANRGENITVIFINNANYGMTGGQMAPTTLPGQSTTTTPNGRTEDSEGKPLRVSELLATLDGTKYIERVATNNAENIKKTREAIRRAFKCQLDNKGYSFVEILCACPTNWKKDMKGSLNFLEEMQKYFPLGVIKDER